MTLLAWMVLIESLVIVSGVGVFLQRWWNRLGEVNRAVEPRKPVPLINALAELSKPANPPDLPDDEFHVLAQIQANPRYAGRPPEAQREAARIIAHRAREFLGRSTAPRKGPAA